MVFCPLSSSVLLPVPTGSRLEKCSQPHVKHTSLHHGYHLQAWVCRNLLAKLLPDQVCPNCLLGNHIHHRRSTLLESCLPLLHQVEGRSPPKSGRLKLFTSNWKTSHLLACGLSALQEKHHRSCFFFSLTDTCYILSFSIIMLNTSLHNPNVKDKPPFERFVSINRGINDGADLPQELLKVRKVLISHFIISPSFLSGSSFTLNIRSIDLSVI